MDDQSIENRCVWLGSDEITQRYRKEQERRHAIMRSVNFNMRFERCKQYLRDRQKEAKTTGQTVIDYEAHCEEVYNNFINQRKPQ